MASVFTRIIDGDLPGRFLWRDERCVAFLSIAPLRPGHALVVPVEEVDHWLDLDAEVAAHLTRVAQAVGRAQHRALAPPRVGLLVAGFEVPHTHLHVVPIRSEADLDFANADPDPDPTALDEAASAIRAELAELGHDEVADA